MTTTTLPDTIDHSGLRAALPLLVSVAVLCAVILGGALLARNLAELGLMFLAGR
jgi:hypothetical protein